MQKCLKTKYNNIGIFWYTNRPCDAYVPKGFVNIAKHAVTKLCIYNTKIDCLKKIELKLSYHMFSKLLHHGLINSNR